MKPLKLTAALAAAALAVPTAALAASSHGVTPVAPKSGGAVAKGSRPTFKAKVVGPGTVWIHVCKSKKKDSTGTICSTELIAKMVHKGAYYTYKPKIYNYPGFWLLTPGTYYWQAYRISCTATSTDCNQEGPVTKFVVK